MHREPRRWRTHFGSWVRAYTVPRLTRELQGLGHPVTPHAVYGWLSGRIAPHPDRALAITRLSGGRLSVADIYRHREAVRPAQASRTAAAGAPAPER
jgi:hypothetical protein